MKTILFVGHYGNIGGAGISLLRTARIAEDAGYRAVLCFPAGSPMAEKAAGEGFEVKEYRSQPGSIEYYSGGPPLYRRTYFKKALLQKPFAKEITAVAAKLDPDAVVLNSVTQSFMIPHLKQAGFRTGLFVRETFPKNGSRRMLSRFRKLLSGASGVYFISDYDKNFYGLTSVRTETVRNSVPDSFFLPISREQAGADLGVSESGCFRILYVGGCDEIKGADVIREVSKKLPGNFEIVCCGAKKELTEKLFEGAACKITHLGVVSDMRPAYALCDIAVFPTVKPHQVRPLFEAGAAGIPVVISDFPEISEYVTNGFNAVTVPPGDSGELLLAIMKLYEDSDLREKTSGNNLALAKKNHCTAAVENGLREELSRLTGRNTLFITNIPSPYRVDLFAEMYKTANLTAVFERRASKGREKSWFKGENIPFPYLFPRGLKIGSDKALNPSVKKLVSDPRFTDVVVNGYSSPTEMVAIKKLRSLGLSYTMWIDGGFKREKEPKIIANIKRKYLPGAFRYLSPSDISDDYLTFYGCDPSKIVRYPFTSLSEKDVYPSPADDSEKAAAREVFSLPPGRIALAVGSFIRRKGFLELIGASKECPDLTVVICGGDPTPEYLALINSDSIKNVRFIGFLAKDRLKLLYRACDFFVLPTREDVWGLVVNEAMACGLPVITTDKCVAGLTMVKNGCNGLLIESGISNGRETPGLLMHNTAEALKSYLALPTADLKAQAANAIKTASAYTYEKSAAAFGE